MINIINKSDCCGCTACANICPKQCIHMKDDIEGFKYPSVDKSSCIGCGLCEKVCPMLELPKQVKEEKKYYIVQALDEHVRAESTSGGAFTPLSNVILEKQGVVFGAAFRDNKDFYVEHCYIDEKDKSGKFRGSKYVQSDMNTCMKKCKDFLDGGGLVLFSGTPCQISGLIKYLGKNYDNLYTVDVVCRAVPSPKVFRKYLEWQRKRNRDGIKNIRFRDKHYGYNYSTMSVYSNKGKEYHRGIESDLYLRAFFSGICDRPCCSNCRFRENHASDLTIWDCFNVGEIAPEMDDNKGTTRIAVNTLHGRQLLEMCQDQFKIKPFLLDGGKKERAYAEKLKIDRNQFFVDLDSLGADAFFEKYFPTSMKVRFLGAVRLFSYRIGIYNVLKKVWNIYKNR